MFVRFSYRIGVAVVSLLVAACGGGGGGDGDSTKTCSSFQYQEDAQSYYSANRSSAAGLDGDNDGIACESLPKRPVTAPVTSVVETPAGVWVGTLESGDGVRGVIFQNGDTWFLRTRVTNAGTVGTWLLNGKGTTSNSTFRVLLAPTIRIEPGTTATLEQTTLSLIVQRASSLNGSWNQAVAGYSMQAGYQASQLPVPALSAVTGTYTNPLVSGSAIAISASGALVAKVNETCSISGQLTLGSGDPAYRISLQSAGACPTGYVPGSGVLIVDKLNNQLYLAATSPSVTATLVTAVKQ